MVQNAVLEWSIILTRDERVNKIMTTASQTTTCALLEDCTENLPSSVRAEMDPGPQDMESQVLKRKYNTV